MKFWNCIFCGYNGWHDVSLCKALEQRDLEIRRILKEADK